MDALVGQKFSALRLVVLKLLLLFSHHERRHLNMASSTENTTTEASVTTTSTSSNFTNSTISTTTISTATISTITSFTTPKDNGPNDFTGPIVGGVVGGFVVVACVVLIIMFLVRRRRMSRKKEPPELPDLRTHIEPITQPSPEIPHANNTVYETQDERKDFLRLDQRDSLDDLPQLPLVSVKPSTALIQKAVSENHINRPQQRVAAKLSKDDSGVTSPYVPMGQPRVHRSKQSQGYVNVKEDPKGPDNSLHPLQKSGQKSFSPEHKSSSNRKSSQASTPSESLSEEYINMKENLPDLTPQRYRDRVENAAKKKAKLNIANLDLFDDSNQENYANVTSPSQDVPIPDDASKHIVQPESISNMDTSDEDGSREDYINIETIPNIAQPLKEVSQNIVKSPDSENSTPDTNHSVNNDDGGKLPQYYFNVHKLDIKPPQSAKKTTLTHSKSNSAVKQENNSPKIWAKMAPATLPKPKANAPVDATDSAAEISNNVASLGKKDTSCEQPTEPENEGDGIYENSGEKLSQSSEVNQQKKTSPAVHKLGQKPQVSPKPTRPKV